MARVQGMDENGTNESRDENGRLSPLNPPGAWLGGLRAAVGHNRRYPL
ncbi:MAG: hypothetical protein IPL28_26985 [Chloroflexi bacterium]|nr:hypothetical protein [Chloroflexota bacterium]